METQLIHKIYIICLYVCNDLLAQIIINIIIILIANYFYYYHVILHIIMIDKFCVF